MGYLEFTLSNNRTEKLLVPEGESVEDKLRLFQRKEGEFALGWIPLGSNTYLRYEEVVFVRAKTA
jgi:hypothetical protein